MDQSNEKKVAANGGVGGQGGSGKKIIQGADQLIKNITQISSNHISSAGAASGAGNILKNWDSIKKYKLENNRVKEKINNVVKHNEVEDANQKQKIIKIQEQGSSWTKKVQIEIERQELLKKEIEEVKKNMQSKNLKIIGMGQNGNGIGSIQMNEQINEIEHKLDKIKAKNNEMVAQIQKLKEEVKVSRNERAFFDNVFKNLERDMKQKEETIKQIVLDNTLNGYELKKQEEVSIMITKLMEKEQILFKTAYESQMICKNNEIFNVESLLQQNENNDQSKIKESDEDNNDENSDTDSDNSDESDGDDEYNNNGENQNFKNNKNKHHSKSDHHHNHRNNRNSKNDHVSKIQEMKYENFLKIKKDFINKMNNDKQEYDNMTEQIKKLLLMTNSENIDQFKQDYQNIDKQIEELYKESENLNEQISNLRKEMKNLDDQIQGYSEQKECLIRQMDSKRQKLNDRQRIIKDIMNIQQQQKQIKNNSLQIEDDLFIFCQLIPPFLRELNVISDEFLRENIHMNIHPNNVLDFFGTIEKKATLTNQIYQRIQEKQNGINIKRKGKKKETQIGSSHTINHGYTSAGSGNPVNGNINNKLPFNYAKIKEREKKQKAVLDFLDKMDQEKEADSLLMPNHFKQICQNEFSKLNQQNAIQHKSPSNIRESIRLFSHIAPRLIKPSGYK